MSGVNNSSPYLFLYASQQQVFAKDYWFAHGNGEKKLLDLPVLRTFLGQHAAPWHLLALGDSRTFSRRWHVGKFFSRTSLALLRSMRRLDKNLGGLPWWAGQLPLPQRPQRDGEIPKFKGYAPVEKWWFPSEVNMKVIDVQIILWQNYVPGLLLARPQTMSVSP